MSFHFASLRFTPWSLRGEDVLGESKFFAGSKPSMVDATWFVLLHRAHIIDQCTGYDFLAEFPKTKRWQSALLAVEALMRSAPEGFAEEFVNFYLNENTYLGGLMKLGKGQCGATGKAECDSNTLAACCR